jgi:hypothetical protein
MDLLQHFWMDLLDRWESRLYQPAMQTCWKVVIVLQLSADVS